ncbi:MAG TPA: hypothetical protein DDY43_14475 [Synechococcales bacterium UBA10510]|nr:hypothetical protein [Synechococcales bacterium UBA10510]
MPTPATDAELAALVIEFLKDPAAYRRFLGRLRPRLVGRPHPRRRLPTVRGWCGAPRPRAHGAYP